MTINDAVRALAGVMVILSVALTYYVSPWFLLFTALHRPQPAAIGLHRLLPAVFRFQEARAEGNPIGGETAGGRRRAPVRLSRRRGVAGARPEGQCAREKNKAF